MSDRIIGPEKFKDIFQQSISVCMDSLLKVWDKPRAYTFEMLGDKNTPGLIADVASRLDLQVPGDPSISD